MNEILSALQLSPCSKKVHRENCTENPFCWEYPDAMMTPEQRITIIESLGKDFALEKREVYTAPKDKKSKTETQSQATLIQFPNLGVTCYMNTALQSIFHQRLLRQAILKWGSDQQYKKDTVMDCLKQLFQRMLLCNRSRISAKQLVEALKLDTKVQQDSDEFLKLIFSFICSALPDTISKTVRNKCSFSVAHSRECDNCHTTKIGAVEDCFDLELVIDHNNPTFLRSLAIFNSAEVMENDNAVFCDVCNSKQKSFLKTNIQKVPDVLNFHIIRFAFDEHYHKRKDSTCYSFPGSFSSDLLLSGKPIYHLKQVWIHKGDSADSGHYIIDVKKDGEWFRIDDELVYHLALHEVGVSCTEKKVNKKRKQGTPNETFKSTGCSMLVFEIENDDETIDETTLVDRQSFNEIMKENNEFSEALNDYNIKKQSLTDQLNAFEALTKGIVESQNVFLYYFFSVGKHISDESELFYFPSEFAQNVMIFNKSKEIKTVPFTVCEHNNYFAKIDGFKVTDKKGKEMIETYFDSSIQSFNENDFCKSCAEKYLYEIKQNSDNKEIIESIKQSLAKRKREKVPFIISNKFLQSFLNGERNAFNFDCDPNQDLICSHGNPFFDTSLTKRITDKGFRAFKKTFKNITEITEKTKLCELCSEKRLTERKEANLSKKKAKEEKKMFTVYPCNGIMALVSREFFINWGLLLTDVEVKPIMDNKTLICEHGKFKYEPIIDIYYTPNTIPKTVLETLQYFKQSSLPFVPIPMDVFQKLTRLYENDGTKIAYDYDKKEFIDGLLCCEKCSTSFSESFEYEDGEISFELEKGCSKRNKIIRKVSNVSSSSELIMLLFQFCENAQSWDLLPEQMSVFDNNNRCLNVNLTLSENKVHNGEILHIRKKTQKELLEQEASFSRELEKGFAGSVLSQ